MWEVKAGTTIRVSAPHGVLNGPAAVVEGDWTLYDTAPWKGYVTKQDRIYEKEQVWDVIAVINHREDIPAWARHNIQLSEGRDVIIWDTNKAGQRCYAMVRRVDITYLE